MSIQRLFLIIFVMCLPYLGGCGYKNTSIPVFDIEQPMPNQIKFNSEKIMYVHGAGAGTPAYLGPKTIIFEYNPLDGVRENSKKFLEKFESHKNIKLIVAHSYGTNLVVWAIENCLELDAFKNVSVLLLAPTLAGAEDAIGASGLLPQVAMGVINIFGPDYRTISADQDPFGEMINNIWNNFSDFIQKTKEVVCMIVSGDNYEPNDSSPEIMKKNYGKLEPFSVELASLTKDPHNEILEREETLLAMADML